MLKLRMRAKFRRSANKKSSVTNEIDIGGVCLFSFSSSESESDADPRGAAESTPFWQKGVE